MALSRAVKEAILRKRGIGVTHNIDRLSEEQFTRLASSVGGLQAFGVHSDKTAADPTRTATPTVNTGSTMQAPPQTLAEKLNSLTAGWDENEKGFLTQQLQNNSQLAQLMSRNPQSVISQVRTQLDQNKLQATGGADAGSNILDGQGNVAQPKTGLDMVTDLGARVNSGEITPQEMLQQIQQSQLPQPPPQPPPTNTAQAPPPAATPPPQTATPTPAPKQAPEDPRITAAKKSFNEGGFQGFIDHTKANNPAQPQPPSGPVHQGPGSGGAPAPPTPPPVQPPTPPPAATPPPQPQPAPPPSQPKPPPVVAAPPPAAPTVNDQMTQMQSQLDQLMNRKPQQQDFSQQFGGINQQLQALQNRPAAPQFDQNAFAQQLGNTFNQQNQQQLGNLGEQFNQGFNAFGDKFSSALGEQFGSLGESFGEGLGQLGTQFGGLSTGLQGLIQQQQQGTQGLQQSIADLLQGQQNTSQDLMSGITTAMQNQNAPLLDLLSQQRDSSQQFFTDFQSQQQQRLAETRAAQAAEAERTGALDTQLEELINLRLAKQGQTDATTQANLDRFGMQREDEQAQLREQLQGLGLLTRGGDTAEQLSKFTGQSLLGRQNIEAQGQQRQERAFQDALQLLQSRRANTQLDAGIRQQEQQLGLQEGQLGLQSFGQAMQGAGQQNQLNMQGLGLANQVSGQFGQQGLQGTGQLGNLVGQQFQQGSQGMGQIGDMALQNQQLGLEGALGFGQLGQRKTEMGVDASLRNQEFGLKQELGRGELGLGQQEADTRRQLGMGELGLGFAKQRAQESQFGQTFDEDVRRSDRGFGEGQRQFDQTDDFRNRQLGIDEAMRQGNLDLAGERLTEDKRQFDLDNQRLTNQANRENRDNIFAGAFTGLEHLGVFDSLADNGLFNTLGGIPGLGFLRGGDNNVANAASNLARGAGNTLQNSPLAGLTGSAADAIKGLNPGINLPGMPGGMSGLMGKAGPAAGMHGLGQLGGNLVESLTGSQIGGGMARGAGTGAAIGSIVPGVGTAIGAGIGAAIGGFKNMFGGPSNAETYAGNMENVMQQIGGPQNLVNLDVGTLRKMKDDANKNELHMPSIWFNNILQGTENLADGEPLPEDRKQLAVSGNRKYDFASHWNKRFG